MLTESAVPFKVPCVLLFVNSNVMSIFNFLFNPAVPELEWRHYFDLSSSARALERNSQFRVIEHTKLPSTANCDIENKVINLNISQPPIKLALSYAYELQNMAQHEQYAAIIDKAKNNQISKQDYINQILLREARSVYFRAKVFKEMNLDEKLYPANKAYLDIYNAGLKKSEVEVVRELKLYIQSHGIVRKQFSVTKFYADCYDFYRGKIAWPKKYGQAASSEVICLPDISSRAPLRMGR